jgi:hypothetical protein
MNTSFYLAILAIHSRANSCGTFCDFKLVKLISLKYSKSFTVYGSLSVYNILSTHLISIRLIRRSNKTLDHQPNDIIIIAHQCVLNP